MLKFRTASRLGDSFADFSEGFQVSGYFLILSQQKPIVSRPSMRASVALAAVGAACAALHVSEGAQCDFPRVDATTLDPERFQALFVGASRPVVVSGAAEDWPARRNWRWDTLRKAFNGMPLRVGQGPYPAEETTIGDYLDLGEALADDPDAEAPGIFQYGQLPTSWSLWAHKDRCLPRVSFFHPNSEAIFSDFDLACKLLSENVKVPAFLVGDEDVVRPPNMITHSGIIIGFPRSGIDFHFHQAAINVILQGKKLWFMKVPKSTIRGFEELRNETGVALPSEELFCRQRENLDNHVCTAHARQERIINAVKSHNSGEFISPDLSNPSGREANSIGVFAKMIKTSQVTEEFEEDSEVLRCVQNEGEIVFIPQDTQHAVMNLDRSVAMQMQWNSNLYEDWDERKRLYRYLLHDLDPSEPDPDFEEDPEEICENEKTEE